MIKNKLSNVVKQRLFVGSGVDDIVDSGLRTRLDEYGQYRIDYDHASSSKILKTTMNSDESRREDEIAKDLFARIPKIKYNDIIGYYTNLYVGYVKTENYREKASSGGMVSWVATKLIESGKITGFIHVKKSSTPGFLFEYGISRSAKEIRSGAKSRYYPVELSKVLKEVKNTSGKYAVVAIPEILTELRLLAENDKVIKDRVVYYFGLVCGHQKTTKYAEAIAWEYGIKPGDLEDIDFRVKKNIGSAIQYDMKFKGLVDGKKRSFTVRNNEPFVSSWAHGFFKARFSDFTDNSFNELADITFGDAWLEEYENDPRGNNILIIRNTEIADVIKDGVNNSEIKVDEVDQSTIIRSQSGLIHHTKDELPYRLYKEKTQTGWAPRRRVSIDNSLNAHRKKIQDVRQEIAEKSHEIYRQAVDKDDFLYFKNKMEPLVRRYNELYGVRAKKDGLIKNIINYPKTLKEQKADGAIITLTGYFNYGNILQRYALQKFLKNSGYNFVSYTNFHNNTQSVYTVGKKKHLKTPLRFVKRFMNYQKPYWRVPKIDEIYPETHRNINLINFANKNIWLKEFDANDKYDTYIVGSDQVWRDWWGNREILGYYFLNFLKGRKTKRIAYAASFGNDNIKNVMIKDDIEYVSPYISGFDGISVREESGVGLIRDTWGVDGAVAVVDPTLLLDVGEYSRLIENSVVKYQKTQPIFSYVLGETPEIIDFIRKVQGVRKQAVNKIRAHGGTENDILPPVELWLKGFRDAELVITNSFHGMMFSIINNTDFIIIGRDAGGLARIKDFLSEYGLEDRFVEEANMNKYNLAKLKPIDWKKVNNTLKKNRSKSGQWLLDQIRRA